MLYGVIINGINTLTEYGLCLCADLKIGTPELKENRVDIPGGDGSLNMSYSPQGMPVYKDRRISFTLFKRMGEIDRDQLVSTLRNLWHGLEVDIVLPNDTQHFWHGVISIGDVSNYNTGKIPVDMIAEPYKYKSQETIISQSISDSGTILLRNERMPVVPTVTSNAAVTLSWDGFSVSIAAGEQLIPQLVLKAGETEISVSGSATVSFSYREGCL